MMTVPALICLAMLAFGYQGYVFLKRSWLAKRGWDELLGRVEAIDTESLIRIADVYFHPGSKQLRIEPSEMWEAVGGVGGLGRLYGNADAMLSLAQYAERWNDENGRVISEMMRRDAMRVKRAVVRVQVAYLFQLGMAFSPFHLQEAISSYCLMRGRLLGMYADAHVGLLPRLANTL